MINCAPVLGGGSFLFRFLLLTFLVLLLSACGSKDGEGEGKSKVVSAGAESVWIEGWQQTSAMNINRAGTAVVVANDYMYVIGGVDGRVFLNTVEYAPINADGTLGKWQYASSMNEARGFTSAAVFGDSIYVVGGGNGPSGSNLLSSVERARFLPNGALGPWTQEENQMIVPRRCSKVLVKDNTLFSFGGFGGALLDTVELASFKEDGSLGSWQLEEKVMTMPRYTSGVNLLSDVTYVIGGHDQSRGVGVKSVEWSPVSAEEHQGWQPTSAMQAGRFELATVDHGKFLYALGGITGTEYLDSIEVANVADQGVSEWKYTTALSSARASMSAVVYKDWIYVIGGTNRDGYFNTIEFATFDDQGGLGFFGSKQTLQQYQQQQTARKQQKAQLPNSGVVQEFIHTSGYTYVRVVSPEQGEVWIAGGEMPDLKANDKIGFSTGVLMSNYYSKSLKRSFKALLFVGTIEKQ